MKIKVTQLDEKTRHTVANAILEYFEPEPANSDLTAIDYHELSDRIYRGELLLCEYIDSNE